MKYFKLFIISVIVFGIMLFFISLLFPAKTVVSRAVNMYGKKSAIQQKIPYLYKIAFGDSSSVNNLDNYVDSIAHLNEGEFIKSDHVINYSDTLLFPVAFNPDIKQGIAVYGVTNDTTVVQAFYLIHVPFYKPWNKFGLMLNEAKYGPSLDSAISRIQQRF